jgi:predicted enzyme related to lactoylglutathione lyase
VTGAAALYALEVHRLAAFYQAVAGLEVTESEPGYVVVESAEIELAIVEIPPPLAAEVEVLSPPVRREDTPIKLAFFVPSIADARAKAPDFGGAVDPGEREWTFRAHRICDGTDPEGNVFQLREPLTD